MRFKLLLASITALTLACNDADRAIDPGTSGQLSFSNLEVGQSSVYIRFTGENYFYPNDSTSVYSPDTLIVTVLAKDGDWFTIEESISPGSLSKSDTTHADSVSLRTPTQIYTNRIAVINDSLYFEMDTTDTPGSYLFQSALYGPFYSGEALSLEQITEPEILMHGWKTYYCECDFQGKVSAYNQLDRNYSNLNVVVRNVPMQTDGPGATFLFSREDGFVHLFWANWWTQRAFGWDLL